MKVLLTGATGFVGLALCQALHARGHQVVAVTRRDIHPVGAVGVIPVDTIGPDTDWLPALDGIEALVHLAARVHVMRDRAAAPLEAFRQVNLRGTETLARAAAATGVRRFVYLSSIKVNGEATQPDQAFSEQDLPLPADPYAHSKWEAEQALAEIAAATGLETVILRPPLVYGPEVKANFLSLLRTVRRGLPLPLGLVANRRSLLYLGNLTDAIIACLERPEAAGRTFLVSDDESPSTAELVQSVARHLGRPARLLPVPPMLLRGFGRVLGKAAVVERLMGSLRVDNGEIKRVLGWQPPFTLEDGLALTCAWFQAQPDMT